MRSTVALFRKMYDELPPLFPVEIKHKMEHALSHLEKDDSLTMRAIEDTMIVFGYEVWPWARAYRDFYSLSEAKIGEHFLISKLSKSGKQRYQDFLSYGGHLNDLRSGKSLSFFSDEDRENLRIGLVELRSEVRNYTDRLVVGLEKERYLRRVKEFTKVLYSIKEGLEKLNKLADEEQDHPAIADEIRSKIRAFEHGLCYLGPEHNGEALEYLPQHYKGRKSEMQRMRGIEVPGEFVLED